MPHTSEERKKEYLKEYRQRPQTKENRKRYEKNRADKRRAMGLPPRESDRYKTDPKIRLKKYKKAAARRNIAWGLSDEFAIGLFFESCDYCGEPYRPEALMGIDRVDNSKGYLTDNVAPCCKDCNTMKQTFSAAFFTQQCRKIATHTEKRMEEN